MSIPPAVCRRKNAAGKSQHGPDTHHIANHTDNCRDYHRPPRAQYHRCHNIHKMLGGVYLCDRHPLRLQDNKRGYFFQQLKPGYCKFFD